ncbi:hypothetical protein [Halobellus marinus]|uniref:hypothetical protein n=1 Tax=Halobellus TaxID=1073986 RepID=UPI0028B12D30|nr:hypothetical protein [Halobellus sp. DFY28]
MAAFFDGLTDYEIWATRDVYTSAKARRRDEPAYNHVLVRTAQPIPVAHPPDHQLLTMGLLVTLTKLGLGLAFLLAAPLAFIHAVITGTSQLSALLKSYSPDKLSSETADR